MQSGKIFGLLIVAVDGLISVEPGVVTMGPDENHDATGPAIAMVGGGKKRIFCRWRYDDWWVVQRVGPPSKDELIPANRTLVFNQCFVPGKSWYWCAGSISGTNDADC
jgi:hypothetical protein